MMTIDTNDLATVTGGARRNTTPTSVQNQPLIDSITLLQTQIQDLARLQLQQQQRSPFGF